MPQNNKLPTSFYVHMYLPDKKYFNDNSDQSFGKNFGMSGLQWQFLSYRQRLTDWVGVWCGVVYGAMCGDKRQLCGVAWCGIVQ